MKPDAKSAAVIYWREFEKLAVQMISAEFNITPDVVYVTRPSKDGGFDALMTHELATTEKLGIHHITLLEAKMRSAKDSLGLRAFAATLVLAYNFAAQTLIVVANRAFSNQALQQALRFKWKTNMQIKLIDGPTVSDWIRGHYEKLVKDYPHQLLDFLVHDSPKTESSREMKITDTAEPELKEAFTFSSGLSGRIQLGLTRNGRIAPCEVVLEGPANGSSDNGLVPQRFPLIGGRRKDMARRLVNTLMADSGIAVLHGGAGVGKSVLIQHVLRGLIRNGFPIATINLSYVLTSRQLFVNLLTALSGIDPTLAMNDNVSELDLAHLISHAGGKPASNQVQNAVIDVLHGTVDRYHKHRDLNDLLLMDFLEEVVRPHAKRHRPILVFEELNRTSSETLEFLNVACHRIARAGITVLIELRDSGYATIIPSKQWEMFTRLFLNTSTLGNFSVEPLTAKEADEYLEALLPGIGPQRSRVIRKRIGLVPLFLYLTSVWLEKEKIVSKESGPVLVEDLERFFEGMSPDNCNTILDRLILTWRERVDYPFADCMSGAVLLDGKLSIRELSIIAPDIDPISLGDALQNTGLFSASPSNPNELEILHDLLLDRMSIIEKRTPFRRARVASLILPHLNSLISNPFARELRSAVLLSAMGRWEEVYPVALECGRELSRTRQWGQSAQYLELAHKAARLLDDSEERSIASIYALVELLEVEAMRYRIGLERNINHLDSLNSELKLAPESHLGSDSHELHLRTMILDWRAHFVREDFQEAFQTATQCRDFALQVLEDVDIELVGESLSNHAMTLKVLDRRKESFEAFDEALRVVPNSVTLKAERLSNIAAFALRDKPDLALRCYREILSGVEGSDYSFLHIIHTHVDIAMANFLKLDYDASMKDAASALLLAESNGVPAEEARARNIIGCCFWARNNIKEADNAFDMAAFASERTMSHRFLWRMRTNRAGTALEIGRKDVAFVQAKSAERAIIMPRVDNFPTISNNEHHITSRWYVALLAIGLYYHRLDKARDLESLIEKVRLPHFRNHVESVISGEFPDEVFAHTTHLHGNRIMITG